MLADAVDTRPDFGDLPPTIRRASDPSTLQSPLPPQVSEALGDPSNVFGRYVRLAELGRGGMGAIYLAWDLELSRRVALKMPKFDDPDDIARFRREALVAGSINHPNIPQVYEVGESRHHVYLAMQLIDGESAGRWKGPARRAAQIVRDAARAVDAAHQNDIIHRDLKPENLMIDREGRVYVMDFGLAKRQEGELAVSVSAVVGTPPYMSPEQARGDAIDARTDVYSLGATLYALVAGRPPFTGTTPQEVMRKVRDEDPRPLRKIEPEVERDLELIVGKSMEKEVSRRYASAADLAEDLERWLAGEPIRARPASLTYRLRKRIRRNPVGWALAALLVLAIVGGTAGTLASASAARRQERQDRFNDAVGRAAATLAGAPRLEQLREGRDASGAESPAQRTARESALGAHLAAAAMLERALAIHEDPQVRRERLAVGESLVEIALLGSDYTLARHHASLLAEYGGDSTAALDRVREHEQHEARREKERIGEILEELEQGLDRPDREPGAPLLEDYWIEATRYRREQTVDLLRAALGSFVGAPPRTERERVTATFCVRVLQRLRLPGAERALAELAGSGLILDEARLVYLLEPWEEYAIEVAGFQREQTVELMEQILSPYTDRARRDGRKSAWTDRDRVKIRFACRVLGRSNMDAAVGALADVLGVIWDDHLAAECGIALCNTRRAEAWDPLVGARERLGMSSIAWARIAPWFARVPVPDGVQEPQSPSQFTDRGLLRLDRRDATAAIRDFTRALALDSRDARALGGRANAYVSQGEAEAELGQDPSAAYGRAIDDYTRALELNPNIAVAYNNRAKAYLGRGATQAARGEYPSASYDHAIEDCTRALQRDPFLATSCILRGLAYARQGDTEAAQGRDPRDNYAQAIENFGQALNLNPGYAEAYNNRGLVYKSLGRVEVERGEDPTASYARAIDDYTRALKLESNNAGAYNNRGSAYSHLGDADSARGEDPSAHYDRAIEDFTRALELKPDAAIAHNNRGLAWVGRGEAAARRGEDPSTSYSHAIEDFDRALQMKPNYAGAYSNRGNAYRCRGNAQVERGEDPRSSYERAIEDYTHALELKPDAAIAHNGRGVVYSARADAEYERGDDPRASYGRAIEDFDRALQTNPNDPVTYNNRGEAYRDRGEAEFERGDDPRVSYERAIEDLTQALELKPDFAIAYNNRGLAYLYLGGVAMGRNQDPRASFDSAVRDLSHALELTPDYAQAHYNRGFARLYLADYAGAAEDWQTAIKLEPRNEPELRPLIERARARLAEGSEF